MQLPTKQFKGVSVVVCCYNSTTRLPDTLRHIANQQITQPIFWELIVVNNNSTDNTTIVAYKEWAQYEASIPFKIVDELIPGLSAAREKGISEAQFEYVLLCDDDNWLAPTFVQTAYEIMESNSQIGVLGGRGEAVSEIAFPYWFSTYQGSYAVGVQALHSGDLSNHGHVWGAGMIFRKSVYQKLRQAGFTHLLSDRKGKNLTSGGDSEICQWFLLANYTLWYDDRLEFKHFIPKERLTKEYCEKLIAGLGSSSAVLSTYHSIIQIQQYPVHPLKKILRFSQALIRYILGMILSNQKQKERALLNLEIHNLIPSIIFSHDAYHIKKAISDFFKMHTDNQFESDF